MDNIEFNSVEQVDELYLKLIDEYNDVLAQFEELDELDDSIQELRCLNLDRYDFSLMAEVYSAIDNNYTANECIENMEECEKEIDEIREKVTGIDLKEHLFNLYNLEYRKEQYEIQLAACEKYLEKCSHHKEMKKKKALIRPASPKRTVEEKRAIRPASPRRTGASYTPEKKEKIEDIPKLQTLTPIQTVPKLEPVVETKVQKPPTPEIPPIPQLPELEQKIELEPTIVLPAIVPKKREKVTKVKNTTAPLPDLSILPSLDVIASTAPIVSETVEPPKKKGGRGKKNTD
jgi:hypothetical protein